MKAGKQENSRQLVRTITILFAILPLTLTVKFSHAMTMGKKEDTEAEAEAEATTSAPESSRTPVTDWATKPMNTDHKEELEKIKDSWMVRKDEDEDGLFSIFVRKTDPVKICI